MELSSTNSHEGSKNVNRETIKSLLSEHGLRPNKALGQNFLADEEAANAILSAASPCGKTVLEIGPGLGALTRGLCEKAKHVLAVEIDSAMVRVLQETLAAEFDNLTVYECDILKFDLPAAIGNLKETRFDAVGNLPYYITTPIAERLMGYGADALTLMVQREAKERFFAPPKSRVYGPLSVVCAACYEGEAVLELPPESYFPAPEVHSSVLRFIKRADVPNPKALFSLTKTAFSMRRKTLCNNLAALPNMTRERARELLVSLGESPDCRAEALPPEQYVRLLSRLEEEKSEEERA